MSRHKTKRNHIHFKDAAYGIMLGESLAEGFKEGLANGQTTDINEIHAKKLAELNEFLQEREFSYRRVGSSVVDVAIDYIKQLEETNDRYEDALKEISTRKMSTYLSSSHMNHDFISTANNALNPE